MSQKLKILKDVATKFPSFSFVEGSSDASGASLTTKQLFHGILD